MAKRQKDTAPKPQAGHTLAHQTNLSAAFHYVSRGWPVFPLHTPTQSGCSCGRPDCDHVGKHPRTKHGFRDAISDEAAIRHWWSQWPDANIGIATGADSGLVVLDIDPRHGGDDTLADWVRDHGPLPDTVESVTGGGGRHIFFAHPGGHVKSRTIAPGVDVKADGGYVVAPPSLHVSGRRYEWEGSSHPDDTPLAPLADWLLATISSPLNDSGATPSGTVESLREGRRNTTLASLAGTMRRRGMSEAAIHQALLVENEQRCEPPLPADEVARIAQSVARYQPVSSSQRPPDSNGNPGDDALGAAPWPEPLAPEAFDGMAGEFVALIDPHTEADPAALLLSFFVAFGNVLGRGPHFVADGARHYTNLYSVLVGRTARGRKGSSWEQVRRAFEAVAADWHLDRVQYGLSSGEGLIWAVRDPIERQQPVREKGRVVDYEMVTEDPGISDKRLLILEQEFASTLRVMGRDGNTLSPTIRQAWDNGDLRVLTKNSPAKASGAHVSIIGHITRDEVLRYLDSTEAGNGFANRFLWASVRRSKLLPDGGHIQEVDFGPFTRRLREVLEFARTAGEMKRDEAARSLWHDVYPDLSQEVPGLLGAVIARAEAQSMRLACIYALLDQAPLVRREHLEAALAVWSYCEASARFIFGDALGDPMADGILRLLRDSPEGLTRTQISNHFRRNRSAAQISRALMLLRELGLADWRPDAPAEGRPAERWFAVRPPRRTASDTTKQTK